MSDVVFPLLLGSGPTGVGSHPWHSSLLVRIRWRRNCVVSGFCRFWLWCRLDTWRLCAVAFSKSSSLGLTTILTIVILVVIVISFVARVQFGHLGSYNITIVTIPPMGHWD